MKKIISKLLVFIIVFNLMIMNFTSVVFADWRNNFTIQTTDSLNEGLSVVGTFDERDAFIKFPLAEGESFTLSYNMLKGAKAEYKISTVGSKATVQYNAKRFVAAAWEDADIKNDGAKFKVRRPVSGAYVGIKEFNDTETASQETYKLELTNAAGGSLVPPNSDTGKGVKFTFAKNNADNGTTGFTFRHKASDTTDEAVVRMKWANGYFYFATSGVSKGNIYEIKLNKTSGALSEKKLYYFSGFSNIKVEPKANGGQGTKLNPVDLGIATNTLAGREPEVDIKFDLPKVWNSTNNDFETLDAGNVNNPANLSISFNSDLGNVKITDIVNAGIISPSGNGITYQKNGGIGTINVKAPNASIEPSKIYGGSKLELHADDLKAIESKFDTLYTYPEMSIIAAGNSQYYLKIKTYKRSGSYTVYHSNDATTLEAKDDKEYQSNLKVSANEEIILMKIDVTKNVDNFYRVLYSKAEKPEQIGSNTLKYYSQIVKFKMSNADAAITNPTNFQVTDEKIIKNLNGEEELIATLKWDVGYQEVLKQVYTNLNGGSEVHLKYDLKKSLKANEGMENFGSITLNITDEGKLQEIKLVPNADLSLKEIVDFKQTELDTTGGKMVSVEVKIRAKAKKKATGDTENAKQFLYPNVYFLTVGGEYYQDLAGHVTIKHQTGDALSQVVTLSDVFKMNLPQPQNIETSDINTDGFKLIWDSMQWTVENHNMYTYYKSMIETLKLLLTETNAGVETLRDKAIVFNAYISTQKEDLEKLKPEATGEHGGNPNVNDNVIEHKITVNGTTSLDFDTVTAPDGGEVKKLVQYLRDGKTIKIADIVQAKEGKENFTFNGLDENQIYYIRFTTTVNPYLKKVDGGIITYEQQLNYAISDYSQLVTVTTSQIESKPDETEKAPAAPTKFDYQNLSSSSADLKWLPVIDGDINSKIEYQLIRLTNTEMTPEQLSSNKSFADTWKFFDNGVVKTGLQTNSSGVRTYNGTSFNTSNSTEYVYTTFGGNKVLKDKTLTPNKIYFYYIRTVRLSKDYDETEKSYSVWVPLSLTTSSIEKPLNLRVIKDNSYDLKTQALINFNVKNISKGLFENGDYSVEYSIQKDGSTWQEPVTIPLADLKIAENPDKSLNMSYLIKGLSSGSLYNIRVRLFSKNDKLYSLYSNIVSHRTNVSSTDQDSEDKEDAVEDAVEDLIKELITEPYWYIKNNTETEVFYRPNHFDNIIATAQGSEISLDVGNGGSKKVYYLPSVVIEQAFNSNKGFKIAYNQTDVIISPKAIDPNKNTSILDAKERVKSNQSSYDYMVKITVNFTQTNTNINGSTAISPIIETYMDTIVTGKTMSDLDDEILNKFYKIVTKSDVTSDFDKIIENAISSGKTNAEIFTIIKEYLDKYKLELGDTINTLIKDTSNKSIPAIFLNGNMTIANTVDNTLTAKAYKYLSNNWSNITLSNHGAKKSIVTPDFGKYIIVATKLVISGLENMENNQGVLNIVNKYMLEDLLSTSGSINVKRNLTRNMAIGSIARIAGASKLNDPVQYLRSKGIVISNRTSDSNISTQETIYLFMKCYELKTNTKIENIKVRNYSLTSNIKGINSNYKKSIQVAYELGIYNDLNMVPNASITIEKFLQSLDKLSQKVNL